MAAVTACKAVGIAIKSIPVIGWIIAIVAAIGALFAYFWNVSAKFRGVIKGIGAFFVAIFKGMWDVAKDVIGGLAKALAKVVTFQFGDAWDEIKKIGTSFANYGKAAGQAFAKAYQDEVDKAESAKKDEDPTITELQGLQNGIVTPDAGTPSPIAGTLGGIGGGSEKTDRIKNINVTIEKVIDSFTIETTNMQKSKERIKDMVAEVLLSAINDVNYAV